MSDSDEDLLHNNIFTYANENTTINARGPNVTNNNITGLSFRNNVLTSTMRMPVNFERQRYGGSNYDQRSMYYRREMSPMSLRGASDFGSGNYNHSIYRNGMSCRSMYHGRGVSPASVRSIDSTATVSAADIVFAFNNAKFDSRDLRIIKEAYNKLIRPHRRKKIEKRRNLRMLLKGSRRKSGEDSGEQGSNSSMSSDDCRSIKTTTCYENVPGLNHMRDISHLSTNIRENQMVRDCTQSIKQNTFRNTFSVNSTELNYASKSVSVLKDQIPPLINAQNMSTMSQKERFKKGFLLPSQRFNKSVIAPKQREITSKNNTNQSSRVVGSESDGESEEIFRGFSLRETQDENISRKRVLDSEDIQCNKKRPKFNSPKRYKNSEPSHTSCHNHDPSQEDFIFAKPNLPQRKGDIKRDFGPERLLAKSRVPVIMEENDLIVAQSNKSVEKEHNNDRAKCDKNEEENKNNNENDTLNPTSDMSMRPSFIKRKLFTQKLDVAENKNLSSDNINTKTPQNIYTEALRERSRARKLVTSQSCLSRDIAGEDSNVLDLIHKIVPPEQINITNAANKMELSNNKSNHINNDGKWDVTTAILNSNNQDISDTYTDEEIFNMTYNKDSTKSKELRQKSKQSSNEKSQCKIVVKKLSPQTIKKCLKINNNDDELPKLKSTKENSSKKRVTDCVKSFWDTDFESDIEFSVASSLKTNKQVNQDFIPQKKPISPKSKQDNSIKKPPIVKGILTVRNGLREQQLNISLKSLNNQTLKEGGTKNVEIPKTKAVVKSNVKTPQLEKNKNDANVVIHTGTKKKNIKENVPVISKQQETGRTPKAKQCIDCSYEQSSVTSKKNCNLKSKKSEITADNKKQVYNKSNNNKPALKPTQKSKDATPKPKQTSNIKITKSTQKSNITPQKDTGNVRKQPKRKSKERSLLQSQKLKNNSNKVKVSNNGKSKSVTELVLNSSLHNSLNTRTTRSSREKISFDNSLCDQSSVNISNLSNRSLRLRQRKMHEYKAI